MAINRAQARQQLTQRTQDNAGRVGSSGKFSDFFRTDVGTIPSWTCKEGMHEIDIIPFVVGNHYPTRTEAGLRPGDLTYVLDLFAHYGIGINEDAYVCPNRNYGEHCPICQHADIVRKMIPDEVFDSKTPESDPDWGEQIKLYFSLNPKRRCVYNVLVWDGWTSNQNVLDNHVQVWDVSHYLFEKDLLAQSELPRGGGFIPFSDLDVGKSIIFKREGSRRNTKFAGIRFQDRLEPITVEHEEEAFQLDEIIHIPDYAELWEAHFGEPYRQGMTVAAFIGGAAGNVESVPDQTPAIRGRGAATPAEQAPPAEAPAAGDRRAPLSAEPTTPAAAPATRRQATAASPSGDRCPIQGGTFGTSIDQLNECNACDVWDNCSRRKAEMDAAQSAPTGRGTASTTQAPPVEQSAGRRRRI